MGCYDQVILWTVLPLLPFTWVLVFLCFFYSLPVYGRAVANRVPSKIQKYVVNHLIGSNFHL
jgi:hypothetical protein